MQIRDRGDEAIQEILAEALDDLKRRSAAWRLELDGETGNLQIRVGEQHALCAEANVTPRFLEPAEGEPIGGSAVSEPERVLRFRSQLRRRVLAVTQTLSMPQPWPEKVA